MNKQLDELFYDPSQGFVSSDKLYKKARLNGINVTQKDVDDYISKQYVTQVFKKVQRPKHFSTIIEYKCLTKGCR